MSPQVAFSYDITSRATQGKQVSGVGNSKSVALVAWYKVQGIGYRVCFPSLTFNLEPYTFIFMHPASSGFSQKLSGQVQKSRLPSGKRLDPVHPAGDFRNANSVFFILNHNLAPGNQRIVCQDIDGLAFKL